jgi:hypothetical protein
MKTRDLLLPALFAVALLTTPLPALAQSDDLYFPASNCQPFNAAGFHGSGSQGFSFVPAEGGLYNFDADDPEALVCPVPYERDAVNPRPVTVRVVVDDRHPTRGVFAFLCGRDLTTSGNRICDSTDNFPSIFGLATLELTIQPTTSTRFVWVEVVVPDNADDNNPWTLDGTSGVIGYRVMRQ